MLVKNKNRNPNKVSELNITKKVLIITKHKNIILCCLIDKVRIDFRKNTTPKNKDIVVNMQTRYQT